MSDGEEQPMHVLHPVPNEKLCPKLKELVKPELQKYIHEPPGPGMAVIYVEVSPSGKMYVGQHIHGVEGKSYYKTRFKAKSKFPGTPAIFNAFKKYGPENMKSFIIARCEAGNKQFIKDGDSNELEEYFISYLDTISPKGYNLRRGGLNAEWHEESKQKLKDYWADPQNNALQRASIKSSLDNVEARERKRKAAIDCCTTELREVRRKNMLNRSSESKTKMIESARLKRDVQNQEKLQSELRACGDDDVLKEETITNHNLMLERRRRCAENQARFRKRKTMIANYPDEHVAFKRYISPENEALRVQRLQATVKAKNDAKLKEKLDKCGSHPAHRQKIIEEHEKWLEKKQKDKEAQAKRRMDMKSIPIQSI